MTITLTQTTSGTLGERRRRWTVTGVAGFIGSNLLERLLMSDQEVVGLDNFLTGRRDNLEDVASTVGAARWRNFTFIEGDIRSAQDCQRAIAGSEIVLHQAALGSVPRSLENPGPTNDHNVSGFLQVLDTARRSQVQRFVFASSSSVYGDSPRVPKIESEIGKALSPYAVSKYVNEVYAEVFTRCYGMPIIGLRYFNVFGKRQDPAGVYAAVIPKWARALLLGEPVQIFGDGTTARDFCYIDNVVQANLAAALATSAEATGRVYNVAFHQRTTLVQLFALIRDTLVALGHDAAATATPQFGAFRAGDIHQSLADISLARRLLGYEPAVDVVQGLRLALPWYAARFAPGVEVRRAQ